jgi:hypothetical protein
MPAARAAAFVDAASRGLDYLPGEVLVKFRDGVTSSRQQRALDAVRSRPSLDALEWSGGIAILRDPSQPDANVLAEQLASQPEVLYAEPNYIRRHDVTPNDTGFGPRQWNLQALDMPKAWDINPGANATVIVAVVDTGITTENTTRTVATWNGSAIQTITVAYATNPDLAASRLVSPMDLVTNGGSTVLDSEGHGTHVSSTVGEDTNNALLDAGIAYNARIMPVKVCTSYWDVQFAFSAAGGRGFVPSTAGGCPTSAVGAGIRYAADNGAKVINLSLGGSSPSVTEQDAINYAVGKGVFVAIAAGNEKLEGNPTHYPAFYAETIQGAMAVGATNRSGNRAFYSNTGRCVRQWLHLAVDDPSVAERSVGGPLSPIRFVRRGRLLGDIDGHAACRGPRRASGDPGGQDTRRDRTADQRDRQVSRHARRGGRESERRLGIRSHSAAARAVRLRHPEVGAMRLLFRNVCAIAVLLLAAAVPARGGQAAQPAKAPSPIGLHAYGAFDLDALAARESFDAVVGTSHLTAFGGGVDVVDIWKHLFARVAVTRARKSGSRVFVANGEVFPLGIPLTATMTPVEVGGGWRFVSSKRSRLTPYAGVSFLSMGYTETSKFAEPGENTDERFTGQDVFGGVEVGIVKWLVAAGEVQYRRVPNGLGVGHVSKDFGETDLGGVTARFTIGIRTKK